MSNVKKINTSHSLIGASLLMNKPNLILYTADYLIRDDQYINSKYSKNSNHINEKYFLSIK